MTSSMLIATLAVVMALPPGQADAQTYADGVKIRAAVSTARPPVPAIRTSLANLDYSAVEVLPRKAASVRQGSGKPQRSLGRTVVGGVLGAVGGFFVGGYLGAMIEGDCGCDDPGLTGFMYGAPIGAIVGGVLGAKF